MPACCVSFSLKTKRRRQIARRVTSMPYRVFDRSRLRLQPLGARRHDMDLSALLPLTGQLPAFQHAAIPVLGKRLVQARQAGSARILMMGAHVLRAGVSHYLIDLMERRLVSHIAMNGA